jgi:hypothetical protein
MALKYFIDGAGSFEEPAPPLSADEGPDAGRRLQTWRRMTISQPEDFYRGCQ